ncbi:MAG: monooxygenase, partial [Bradyrhizobium icense]
MLDKPAPAAGETAKDTAERWVEAFDEALRARSDKALAECLVDDSHWRNLFGISWLFATFSGKAAVVRELL